MRTIKNILISGGWGYGNLGDDAILVSTVKILKDIYPGATITVMTYNCGETVKSLADKDVVVVPSLHRSLVNNLSTAKFRISSKFAHNRTTYVERLIGKVTAKFRNVVLYPILDILYYSKFLNLIKDVRRVKMYSEFKNADLFIQGGGGYFNDGWKDNVYAHILELKAAKEAQTRCLIVGQSIGPFKSKRILQHAVNALKQVDLISVRDIESRNELLAQNIQNVLIPDTAISDVEYSYIREPSITVIVGGEGMTIKEIDYISEAIADASRNYNLSVVITVSRIWIPDYELADRLLVALRNHIPNVKFVIPENFVDLQDLLGKSRFLISQNLHGLILAWRAGVPGISLNPGRKFVSFMQQSKQLSRMIPIKTSNKQNLIDGIEDALNAEIDLSHRLTLSNEIKSKIYKCLEDLRNPEYLSQNS
jgi:polysaccharide pyruvyl transferase WcaK-like protein